jgi:hypothetical protein
MAEPVTDILKSHTKKKTPFMQCVSGCRSNRVFAFTREGKRYTQVMTPAADAYSATTSRDSQ